MICRFKVDTAESMAEDFETVSAEPEEEYEEEAGC